MENKNKTVWWVIGIIIVIGLVWFGVSKQSASGSTIKIGFIGPLTGDGAVYGEPFQKTIQLAVDEVNANGGINGKTLEVVYEDDQCTGQAGASASQKLIQTDGVKVIIGSMCSGATLSALPIAEAGKAVIFSPGASSPKLTGASTYFFRNYVSDAAQGKVLADVAAEQKHWTKVAFIQEKTDYAQGIYEAFNEHFTADGGKTTNESFPSGATDFRSFLTKLRAGNPDVLFIDTQAPAATGRVLDQLAQLGWKPHVMINDATAGDPATLKKYAGQLEGAVTAEFVPDETNPKLQALEQAYKTRYNADLPYHSYMGPSYDSIYLLVEGIKAVGYDGPALAAWSHTIKDWSGASGSITIGADGDRVGGHTAEVVHGGKTEILN